MKDNTRKFTAEIRKLTENALAELIKCEEKRAEVKASNYKDEYIAERVKEINEAIYNITVDTERNAKELIAAYKGEKEKELAPKAEELTDDAKLLSSGISFTADELRLMYEKYNNNNTMRRLIREYAERNEMKVIDGKAYTLKDYNEAADNFMAYTRTVLERPQYAEITTSDKYFNNIIPDCMSEE